jgi:hypothetical protein
MTTNLINLSSARLLMLSGVFLTCLLLSSGSLFAQTGTYTCKVDGKPFTATFINAFILKSYDKEYFYLEAKRDKQKIHLEINPTLLKGSLPKTIVWKQPKGVDQDDVKMMYYPTGDLPILIPESGQVVVTAYDPNKQTISGTFQFNLSESIYIAVKKGELQKAIVTEGSFQHVKYRKTGN